MEIGGPEATEKAYEAMRDRVAKNKADREARYDWHAVFPPGWSYPHHHHPLLLTLRSPMWDFLLVLMPLLLV
jgi:hypothetical protein